MPPSASWRCQPTSPPTREARTPSSAAICAVKFEYSTRCRLMRLFSGHSAPSACRSTLWRAMGRYAPWIEPAIISEWIQMIRGYQKANRDSWDSLMADLRWLEPEHDTGLVRDRAQTLRRHGTPLFCVWTGRRPAREFCRRPFAFPLPPGPAMICGTSYRVRKALIARRVTGFPLRRCWKPQSRASANGGIQPTSATMPWPKDSRTNREARFPPLWMPRAPCPWNPCSKG